MSYRAENNSVSLVRENVDLNTVGISSIATIPPGVSFAILSVIAVSNSFTPGSSSTVSIGTAGGGYQNIVNAATLNSFTASNQTTGIGPDSLSPTIPAGTEIFINVTPPGLPPGPFSAQFALIGYYF